MLRGISPRRKRSGASEQFHTVKSRTADMPIVHVSNASSCASVRSTEMHWRATTVSTIGGGGGGTGGVRVAMVHELASLLHAAPGGCTTGCGTTSFGSRLSVGLDGVPLACGKQFVIVPSGGIVSARREEWEDESGEKVGGRMQARGSRRSCALAVLCTRDERSRQCRARVRKGRARARETQAWAELQSQS